MSEYLKVEGYNNLVRDTKSHAIINTDRTAYQMAIEAVASTDDVRGFTSVFSAH